MEADRKPDARSPVMHHAEDAALAGLLGLVFGMLVTLAMVFGALVALALVVSFSRLFDLVHAALVAVG
jgi:uncharacterized membrane protein